MMPNIPTSMNDIEGQADAAAELATSKKVSFDERNLRNNLQSRLKHVSRPISITEFRSSHEDDEMDDEKQESLTTFQEPDPSPEDYDDEEVDAVVKPKENDILSGRGTGVNLHPGNVFFRQLIQSKKALYVKSDPGTKKRIIRDIVELATQHGRFLKQDPETELWVAISGEEVKKKTGQALRENAPAMKKLNKQKSDEMRRNMTIAQLASMANFIPSELESITTASTVTTPTMSVPSTAQSQLHQIRNSMNHLGGAASFGLSTHSQNHLLWSRMNLLSEKQEQLKRKQRELEDEQNRLMQYFYQMTAASALSPPLSSFSKSSQALFETRNVGDRQESKLGDNIYSRAEKKRRIMVPGQC